MVIIAYQYEGIIWFINFHYTLFEMVKVGNPRRFMKFYLIMFKFHKLWAMVAHLRNWHLDETILVTVNKFLPE